MRSPCASTVVRSNGATSTRSDEQPSLWGLSNVAAAASGRTPGVFATRSSAVAAPARAAHGAVASSATRASDCVARQANVAAASPDSHCLTRCVESRVASAVEHVPDRRRRRTRDAENSAVVMVQEGVAPSETDPTCLCKKPFHPPPGVHTASALHTPETASGGFSLGSPKLSDASPASIAGAPRSAPVDVGEGDCRKRQRSRCKL